MTSTQLENFAERHSELHCQPPAYEVSCDTPVIAEATSSVDFFPTSKQMTPSPSDEFITEDDYSGDIASQVELSSDGVPTKWYHQQEHDYLKNEMEPESSGMEDIDDSYDNDAVLETELDNCEELSSNEDVEKPDRNFPMSLHSTMVGVGDENAQINNYDTELPQDIFNKEADEEFQAGCSSNVIAKNYLHPQEPVIVRQIIDSPRFNATVMHKEPNVIHQENGFVMEEVNIDNVRAYRNSSEGSMNVPKNVKLLAFPSKYNVIEEVSFISSLLAS